MDNNTTSVSTEEIIHGANGQTIRKTTTRTTRKVVSGHHESSEKDAAAAPAPAPAGFLYRVSSLPLVHDTVSTFHNYALDNKYGRYALDTAGSAVGTVSKYTEGYQNRLQPAFSKVDELANKSLDVIETTFPIVTKPTAEIVTTMKKPIVSVGESSMNAYTQLQSTIDSRVTVPVMSVASTVATKAAETRDQITTVATATATTVATRVNTHATPLVDGLETIVNRILPAEGAESTPGQTNQATRVVDLGRNVSLRVSRRVSVSVAPLAQSALDLRRAAENHAALIKSKESIHALNIRLNAMVDSLRLHAKELQENVQKVPGEASVRVQALSSTVMSEIDSLSLYLREHSPRLPEYVQVRLEPLVGFMNDRYTTVMVELGKADVSALQKARNILQLTTEETLPILQSAAQDVKESLLQYQSLIQDNVQRGLTKVHEVNSSVSGAVTGAVQSARVSLVGSN